MSKSEFARQMGIRKQNVNVLFKSKNLVTIRKAADVLGVPFSMLVGYTEEPDLYTATFYPDNESPINEDDIPTGVTA